MNLYVWHGIDVGGEYADAWIGVIAKTPERARALIENDEREWIQHYMTGVWEAPEVLPLRASEKIERIWLCGS